MLGGGAGKEMRVNTPLREADVVITFLNASDYV